MSALRRWFRQSLLRRLWVWTTLLVVLFGTGTAAISYLFGYNEANEYQDIQLRQIASLVHRWGTLPPTVLAPDGGDADRETSIIVEPLEPGSASRVADLPQTLTDGLQTVQAGGFSWRVFVSEGAAGRIAVAQRTDVRMEAAVDSAQRTLFPLLGLIPVLVLMIGWVVRRALRPVRDLAHEVDARDEQQLEPLPMGEVPFEIRPFLGSINRLIARLAATRERERRFVADAAHELRTPIAALSLQAENLEHSDLPRESRDRLALLRLGLGRTRAVVEQLLDLARVQSGPPRAFQLVRLQSLLRQVASDVQPLAERHGVQLRALAGDVISVSSDPTQLYTLVRNAVDNAVRYTPRSGEVTLRAYVTTGQIPQAIIEVADTGPGIPDALIPRAFEPFERLGQPPTTTGSGLGLAIMRGTADNLGAELILSNRPQGGLLVQIKLPVGHAPAAP